ncbi:class I SAM-dependent methyltransferase [Arthrobacter sp. Z1-15]
MAHQIILDSIEDASAYGNSFADIYDQVYPHTPDVELSCSFINELVGADAAVLEMGVGTGRTAIPLAASGTRVHGVDISERMLKKLSEREGGSEVACTQADFITVDLGQHYDAVIMVLNTFFAPRLQQEQQSLMHNLAKHTRPGGYVVIEAFDPMVMVKARPTEYAFRNLSEKSIMLDTINVDTTSQVVFVIHTVLDGSAPWVIPEFIRYVWPGELDLMAAQAGLELIERSGGWERTPFTADSGRHVSVYQKSLE